MEKDTACSKEHRHIAAIKQATTNMPTDDNVINLSETFKILSDSSRLKIIFALMSNELCVCDICAVVGMNPSAVSHQLRLLRSAALVKYRRNGKQVFYSLDDEHVYGIIAQTYEHIKHLKTE